MGKSKDKKKKGKGMEKTLAKTEKKIQKNIKKELEEIGEDDVESLIAAFVEGEKQLNQVKEEILPAGKMPSRRGGATFNLFPERDELILFGGEYYDGKKVFMYNDLFVYSIKKNQWTLIKAPNGPPPRTFHQAAFVSRNNGELWVFGGEFSSASQSQFYHYNDLWMFSFQEKKWTKINSPNGPSARSGHRMVVFKKYLVIFGGFYDNLRNCRFYNDTILFNLETLQWEEMKFSATGLSDMPSPRSACQLSVCAKANSIVLYGGFSKEKLKKEKEKGIVHSDMFVLQQEIKKSDKIEWSWKRVKQSGLKPSERISFSMVTLHDDTAVLFGGLYDLKDDEEEDEDEENEASSVFFNDLYKLDLVSYKWSHLNLRGKKEIKTKKSAKADADSDQEMDTEASDKSLDEEKSEETLRVEQLSLKQEEEKAADSVFQLTISAKEKIEPSEDFEVKVKEATQKPSDIFLPQPRRSSYLQFHKGVLYLYGGRFEEKDDKEITLNDMYCLNLKKLDEWKCLFEDKELKVELKKTVESEGSGNEEDEEDDDDDESSDMEIDAPEIEPDETLEAYFARTNEIWLEEAAAEFPDEKSKKIIKKMAQELCAMFWQSCKETTDSKK